MITKGGVVLVIATVVAGSCCAPGAVQPISHDRCGPVLEGQQDEVRSLVVERLLQSDQITRTQHADVIFVGIKESGGPEFDSLGWDPSREFMNRFVSHRPPVRPISEALTLASDFRVRDRATGQPGIIVSIRSVCWLTASDVEVEAVRFFGMNASLDYEFQLKFQSGRWRVVSEINTGAS
jgi:hypothetical protein